MTAVRPSSAIALIALVAVTAAYPTAAQEQRKPQPQRDAADLVELYVQATEFDPIYQVARERWALGEEALRQSRAELRPNIVASADASKVYQNIRKSESFLFSVGSSDFFNSSYSVSISQPVYHGEVLERIPQAQAQARQAAAELVAEEQDLIYRLAEAVFGFLAARDNLDFAVAEREAIQRQLSESEQRLTSGLAKITEVHEARARFALAQATEIAAADALEEARLAIADITGSSPADLKRLSETFPLVAPDRTDADAWVDAALFQNPRIKGLQAAADVASQEIQVQRAGAYRPRLDAVASYTTSDSGGTEFGGGNEIGNATLGLRLSVPIWDGGRGTSQIRGAEAQYRISLHTLDRGRRLIEAETRKAFRGMMSGLKQVEALRQTVFSQEAAVDAKSEGMRAGLATRLEVLDATRDLYMARRDLAKARYDYVLSSLGLKRWAGTLSAAELRQVNAYFQ